MEKSKDQKLLELQQKVRFLERKNARLEKELELKDMKAEFFDMMIDIAEKEYNIDIRKNSSMGHRTKRFFQWSGKMGERL